MAFSTMYRVMDDYLTDFLRPYLAIGYGADGKAYSDVIVKEGNVQIVNLFARPEALNDQLAKSGLPIAVKLFHCNEVKVNIPWFSWSTNPVEIVIGMRRAGSEPTQPETT